MIDYYVAVENNVLNLLYNVSSTYQSSATYELCKKKKILIKQEGKSSLQMRTIIRGGIMADVLFYFLCLSLSSKFPPINTLLL